MRLLLDTHTFIWFFMGNPKLSNQIRALSEDEKMKSCLVQ
jgi:PIN domain nuclease of toxin-antitoxin system